MAKVRHRLAREGTNADIVQKLEDSRNAVRVKSASDASKEKRESFRGEFS